MGGKFPILAVPKNRRFRFWGNLLRVTPPSPDRGRSRRGYNIPIPMRHARVAQAAGRPLALSYNPPRVKQAIDR